MRRIPILLLAFATAGCATTTTDPATLAAANAPLMCANAAQCDTYWKRAQAWVASNSYWKVQTVSDGLIQTYGPSTSVFLAWTVTREAHADGSARIMVNPHCGNPFGCATDRMTKAAEFKKYVAGG